MADLHLALKGEYFDAIKSGTKAEEYRLCNRHWVNRLEKPEGHYDRIVLTRGYPARGDADRRLVLPWRGYTIKTITHPHFGPDPVTVYAIRVTADTDNKEM
ncbi:MULTISPECIES: ASCH domain-containing protein [Achromobacter]|uniref:ASCH domain-containing protein n=1 Tax=Achromobacter TaxID=222 RepID=UPI001F129D6C|nr:MULTISPECIES: ASCH domain-containing protein [Achromobacter]